jgi:acetoin utilization protein AcuC
MKDIRKGKAAFVYASRLSEFKFSPEHPFKPLRVEKVYEMCERKGLFSGPSVAVIKVDEGDEENLAIFHTADYIELLKRAGSGSEVDIDMLYHGIGTMENPIFRGLYQFCLLSVAATLKAVEMVTDGFESAFNPCGGFHHAHSDRAGGFCYVNDAVIAIKKLRELGRRVAYVDIDAHHGDGVQDAFYDDPEVLTISIHESGRTLFPWGGFENEIGKGKGRGFNINIPMEPDTDDEVFTLLFNNIVIDAVRRFDPDVIVGQFGTDTSATDPLTHLKMTNNGYIEAIELMHKNFPKIVALGGGGYNMKSVVNGWTLLWAELAGLEPGGGYGGAIGGVLMGDSSIEGADLKDMRSYISGPAKKELVQSAEKLISYYKEKIQLLI